MFVDYNIKKYILNYLNFDRILILVIMNYVFCKIVYLIVNIDWVFFWLVCFFFLVGK